MTAIWHVAVLVGEYWGFRSRGSVKGKMVAAVVKQTVCLLRKSLCVELGL